MMLASSCNIRTALSVEMKCQKMTEDLSNVNDSAVLDAATKTMWHTFNDSCSDNMSCTFEVKPVAATTNLNFGKMKGTNQYDAVKDACSALGTDESPTTLCTVNSKLTINSGSESEGTPVSDRFKSKREPVCFPYQCTEKEVDIVHGNPLGCDPDLTECVLEAEDAKCPDRPDGAGSGNCHKYSEVVNDDETLTSAITVLSSKASMACVSFQQDDDEDAICTSETAPIQIYLAQHFRTFETDITYENYLNSCYDTNAQTCYMSMAVKMQGEIGFFALDLLGDYNDYPLCMPSICSSDEKIKHASNLIKQDVGVKMREGMSQGFRRKLSNSGIDLSDDSINRMLQNGEDGCPAVGMEICDFQVMDFYCVERGTETGPLTMGSSDATTSSVNSGSFMTAMGMALVAGILL